MANNLSIPKLQTHEWWMTTRYGATYHFVQRRFLHNQKAICGVVAKHRKTKTPPPACICPECLEYLRMLRPEDLRQ